ncbi:LL-diaminopimelate aminotransferase [Natribacillus halophilus]|uniref:Aminotransferase n=1 Tax=Natribacillus halophilus TaxID=549003 RepID=A0A1G8RBE3_9BACI|nr:LL-diaminopimelate aminotransferase [Natribacillus halophilus]SDJ13845.1 LL-diaminopimelate aminotransferase apoenzyme [Natribacillus halophilus]
MSMISNKVADIPPYVFAKINQKKDELKRSGIDIIDLGMGDPDLPTPKPITDKLIDELNNPDNFKYSSFSGCTEFKEAVASFYKKQYNVELNSETEVLALIGSKEGIAHLPFAIIDENDYVLTPDPCYGVYRMATYIAGGKNYDMPLTKEHHYQPDLSVIPEEIKQKAKLMYLNYPGNPTAATVDLSFFNRVLDFAKDNNITIAHDSAYNMITFDESAPSILQADKAKDIAVEFGSLSKSYNMTGWRIGYVVGNPEIIRSLSVVKSNMDTSQFLPIQKAAAFALTEDQKYVHDNVEVYRKRRKVMVEGLNAIGMNVDSPKGSFYIWAPVPEGYTSEGFVEVMLENAGVVVTPGSAFGSTGEGYFRISLTVPTDRLQMAVKRIKDYLQKVTAREG